ncbi:hypothetical protein [Symbiopectobacterium sp. RP]|uniref:hypothetical protein n=1 Tax=Symbiopectobacterium sp. RP TaxID=3248553 RepID=UPI003D286499
MITANALICGKKIQLIVIKIMSLGYIARIANDIPNLLFLRLGQVEIFKHPLIMHAGARATAFTFHHTSFMSMAFLSIIGMRNTRRAKRQCRCHQNRCQFTHSAISLFPVYSLTTIVVLTVLSIDSATSS